MYLMLSRPYRKDFLAGIAAFLLMLVAFSSKAQPGLSFEIKKPKQYENRPLPSEKSADTKFSYPKRLYNNTVSRFNYYFNANRIMNDVITDAKLSHHDDYTQLLSFYNYEFSTSYKSMMDTVIYKATAGILLHDLRSDWVDKLYLLMGKAYLYRKDFDSATTVFQYINYAFAPKDDGYDLPIGSNASNTNGVFTISTRESKSVWKKVMSFPPSRNESFLWQARTYIEQDELSEASGLLELIRVDPNFPERLRTDLHELTAYMLYKRGDYDSSATHLLKALDNAETKLERARWEYLAAQMFALSHNDQQAIALFERAIEHTTDPLMEVYARLSEVSLSVSNQENALQKHIDELLRMAKRDKYETQRDIIYYAAAKLELRRFHYAAAENLLKQSLHYNTDNAAQKQQTLLLLGDMNYTRKLYSPSFHYYDSIQTALLQSVDAQRVTERKPALQVLSENQTIVTREDSLQKLAAMSEEQRVDAANKVLKQLRREKGLKDIPDPNTATSILSSGNDVNPFGNPVTEFYFQNASMRTRGMAEFKSKWGNRPNVDNWRRQNAVDRTLLTAAPTIDARAAAPKDNELTLDGLLKNIPTSGEQIAGSHQAIIKALLGNASTFQNKLEDYQSAIETYEELIKRYPESAEVAEALYNLAYLYRKTGQVERAEQATSDLKRGYPSSPLVNQLNNSNKNAKQFNAAEQAYESIYRMFIEGRFAEAQEAKMAADKQFGKTYWTPQLLYIESIYYIKQKNDSVAINRLQELATNFKSSPLAEKATTMIDVLRRRKEIEAYLANLDVNRPVDDRNRGVDLNNTATLAQQNKRPDSIKAIPQQLKVTDPKNLVNLSNTNTVAAPPTAKTDTMNIAGPKFAAKEQVLAAPETKTVTVKGFSFNIADPQYAIVVLDKVDQIFATEARNAFNRYNQERYTDAQLNIASRKIDDRYTFILVGPFANAGDAVSYTDKTKALAGTRVVPWLAADKYSFLIISDANMNMLVENKDLAGYKALLQQALPGKF
jgi:tetratricopeptide (TPR) repeat protein